MKLGFQFVAVDVIIETHPKVWAAGAAAMGLWTWGLVHAKRHDSKGFLPRQLALAMWGGSGNEELARRLVDAGLWAACEEGWRILNYEAKTMGSVSRNANTERSRRYRERAKARALEASEVKAEPVTESVGEAPKTDSESGALHGALRSVAATRCPLSLSLSVAPPGSSSDFPSDLPSDPFLDLVTERVNLSVAATRAAVAADPPRVLGMDGENGEAFAAWRRGITAVTGKPVSQLAPGERQDVVELANAHAGGQRGEPLMTWLTATAERWARQHDPAFGGYKPRGCRTWLDAGEPAPPSQTRFSGRHLIQSSENRQWIVPEGLG